MKILRVLVTGSTGFLGGRLIQFLSQNTSYKLLLGTRDLTKIPDQFACLDAVVIDWTSQQKLDLICSSVDCIIHLAGMNAGQCAKAKPDELAADVKATEMLLNAAVNSKVNRFIYLSSAHVYKARLVGEINELTEPTNTHPYATNHRAKESLVLQAANNSSMEGIVIRLSNAFGVPVDSNADCWTLLVNDLCKQVVTKGVVTLTTSGKQLRDFITVADFCMAVKHFLHLSLSNKSDDQIFNLGGMYSISVLEMANCIASRSEQVFGFKPQIVVASDSQTDSFQADCDVLNFNCGKLLHSGFHYLDVSQRHEEIDSLLLFCKKKFDVT